MNKLATFLVLSLFAIGASANTGTRGGGDICEDRIKVIRDDLQSWINAGGPAGLTLPAPMTAAGYSQSMLQQIGLARIQCVGAGDVGFPVQINGTAKVCRFDADSESSTITCDYDKFLAMTDSDQYVLVHHEFAGLANIEPPNNDDSQYGISNQISGFLTDVVEKKLAVKPPTPVGGNCNLTAAQQALVPQLAANFIYQALTTQLSSIAGVTVAQSPALSLDVTLAQAGNYYGIVKSLSFNLADQTPVNAQLRTSAGAFAQFNTTVDYNAEQNVSACHLYFADAYVTYVTNTLTTRTIGDLNAPVTGVFYTFGPNP